MNNGDLISRQAAINAVIRETYADGVYGYADIKSLIDALEAIPAAEQKEDRMTICFVFKSGYELKMKCEEFTLQRDALNRPTGFEAKGVTENKLIEFNFNDVLCIYRVFSDEG